MPIDPRTFEKYSGKKMDPYAAGKALAHASGRKSARDLRGPGLIGIVILAIIGGVVMFAKMARRAERAEQRASQRQPMPPSR